MNASGAPDQSFRTDLKQALSAHGASTDPALHQLLSSGLPDRRTEGWRWSDLRAAASTARPGGTTPNTPFDTRGDDVFLCADGAWTPAQSHSIHLARIASTAWQKEPVMGAATAALSGTECRQIEITTTPAAPIRIAMSGQGGHSCALRVRLAAGVSATLIESHVSGGGFSSHALDIELGEAARLNRIIYQEGTDQATQLTTGALRLGSEATLNQTTLMCGAGFSRLETLLSCSDNGHVTMNALYLLHGNRHADHSSLISHSGPNCTTRQMVKGIVCERGGGVFQGKFRVAPPAQQTDARMDHRAILLDERSSAFARPELEIYADDVQCAHGNAIGALDPAALFYMRQRGLNEAQARALLAEGFAVGSFTAIADDDVRARLEGRMKEWLTRYGQ